MPVTASHRLAPPCTASHRLAPPFLELLLSHPQVYLSDTCVPISKLSVRPPKPPVNMQAWMVCVGWRNLTF